MPELRKDIITREWVILAKERAKRPRDFKPQNDAKKVEQFDPNCPFCPGNESKTPPEVLAYRPGDSEPNMVGWRVRVTANKFPALNIEGELERKDIVIYDWMNGVGAHEVVIETPGHGLSIATMEEKQVEDVIWSYCDRYNSLRKDPRLKYILIFRNHG